MRMALPVSSTWDADWRAPASSAGSPAPWPAAAPAAASWCSRRTPSGWCLCSSACPWKKHRAPVTPAVVSRLGVAASEKAGTVWLLWKITAWRDVGQREKLSRAAEEGAECWTAAEGFRHRSFVPDLLIHTLNSTWLSQYTARSISQYPIKRFTTS